MAIFKYKAIDSTGKEIKSSVNAESLAQAKQKLYAANLMLLNIDEQKSDKKGAFSITIGTGIKINDLSLMTRQLATLIKARIPIAEALTALIDQVDNAGLRVILAEVKQKINEGASLAKSFSEYPKVFTNVYVNMVEAGEASGTLDIVLIRLAEFTEAQVKLKNKITSSMMYPMIMAIAGSGMMTFIFVFIIPKIAKIFVSMKKDLPWTTELCISISNFLQNYWYIVLALIPILLFVVKKYVNSKSGKSRWHHLQLKLPIIGNLTKMINIGRFCSTLATLLNSGVPILVSLKIVKNLISNVHMQEVIENARTNVSEGQSLAAPLASSGLFPPMVTHMIQLGEKSGELEPMLQIVSENYDDQVNSKLDGLTSILEPIMMICLGCAVAFVVFSVVIPMMELNSIRK